MPQKNERRDRHRGILNAYLSLLAIEHSFERKYWTVANTDALYNMLELHTSDEWDGEFAPRT